MAYPALKQVRLLLTDQNGNPVDCLLCRLYIFEKLSSGGPPNDNGATVQNHFRTWANLTAQLYNGTTSFAPMYYLCINHLGGQYCDDVSPIKSFFAAHDDTTNLTKFPDDSFVSFYETAHYWGQPSCYVTISTATTGTREKSITFHEMLHGYTGLDDIQLYQVLTGQYQPDQGLASDGITAYIAQHVFGWPEGVGFTCKD